MTYSTSGRSLVAAGGFAALLAACDVQTDIDPPLTGESAAAVTVSAKDSKAKIAQELGERVTPGKGAAQGALAGAGATLQVVDPYAILLLPILVPVGAAVGAASAPSDEEWAEMVADHKRQAANAAHVIPIVDSVEKGDRLERLIAEQFSAVPALAQTCVRTRAQGRNCPVTAASPRLTMQMSHGIIVLKFTEGGLLSGKPKKTIEKYVIRSSLDVRLDMPAPQEDRCLTFDFGALAPLDEASGQFNRQAVEADLIEGLQKVAVLLVLSVFEAPGLDNDARAALARERQEELGLKYTPYPIYSKTCG